jgi:RNA polymerase-interacting CarD/CdnL/TRCF family regulator
MVTSDPLSTREPEIKYPGGNATADPDAVAELQLIEQLKDHELASICRVIRDLTLHKRLKKMNDNDSSTLERSRNFLINEWSLALSIPVQQAENELRKLLDVGENNS